MRRMRTLPEKCSLCKEGDIDVFEENGQITYACDKCTFEVTKEI